MMRKLISRKLGKIRREEKVGVEKAKKKSKRKGRVMTKLVK